MFDWNGKEVYRKARQKVPYIDWARKEMDICKGLETGYGKADRKCHDGLFTLVEEKNGGGRHKNGAGWILLSKTEKK